MPPIPQIPGFYYDPEKRKYFKIEEHAHTAHPYSKDNLAKRRKAEESQTRQTQEQQERTDNLTKLRPIQRWMHSAANIGGYMNAREVGLVTNLEDREVLQAKLLRRQKVWEIRSTESQLEKLVCFTIRESSGHAVIGIEGGLVYAVPINSPEDEDRIFIRHQAITRFTSKVTGIAVSPASDLFVCCSLGKDNYSGIIQIGRFGDNEDRICEIFSVMRPERKQDLYCLTMSRHSPGQFAVGGQYDVLVASGRNDYRTLKPPGNCLALEFLGPHTLAAGARNGIVRLYDDRVEGDEINGTGLSIRHGSSVSQMKQVNDHLIVVEGLQNTLAMYDLRYPHTARNITTPIVKYSGHSNSVTFNLGFDVSPSESILAAAGDDGFVRLWSVQSGQSIHGNISEYPFDDNIIGLQFSQQADNGIWIAGPQLEYWNI